MTALLSEIAAIEGHRDLADRDEQADKAKIAARIERDYSVSRRQDSLGSRKRRSGIPYSG
jgi:hypothetical protein